MIGFLMYLHLGAFKNSEDAGYATDLFVKSGVQLGFIVWMIYSVVRGVHHWVFVLPHARRCPFCGSNDVSRSSRHDIFEKEVLSLLLTRPFRCLECEERHYNFVYSRRMEMETSTQKRWKA